uniref:Uncharacterized protein n=1 Tax=Nymphaea colorata TaxID=210225 RepID=A0A5K1E228_9MAGN
MVREVDTYRVSDHHVRLGTLVAEVQADLHAGITAADNEHPLAAEVLAGLVRAGVENAALELVEAGDVGKNRLGILAGSDDDPLANILGGPPGVGGEVEGADPPEAAQGIELRRKDGLVEARPNAELGCVGVEVGEELVLGGVLGEVGREGEEGELAELLGQVQLQPVVGAVVPQRGDAVGAVEHDARHAEPAEPGGRRQPRRPRPDYHGAVHPHAPRLRLRRRQPIHTPSLSHSSCFSELRKRSTATAESVCARESRVMRREERRRGPLNRGEEGRWRRASMCGATQKEDVKAKEMIGFSIEP